MKSLGCIRDVSREQGLLTRVLSVFSVSKPSPTFNLAPFKCQKDKGLHLSWLSIRCRPTENGPSQGLVLAPLIIPYQSSARLRRLPSLPAQPFEFYAHHYTDMTNEGRRQSCSSLRDSCCKCSWMGWPVMRRNGHDSLV